MSIPQDVQTPAGWEEESDLEGKVSCEIKAVESTLKSPTEKTNEIPISPQEEESKPQEEEYTPNYILYNPEIQGTVPSPKLDSPEELQSSTDLPSLQIQSSLSPSNFQSSLPTQQQNQQSNPKPNRTPPPLPQRQKLDQATIHIENKSTIFTQPKKAPPPLPYRPPVHFKTFPPPPLHPDHKLRSKATTTKNNSTTEIKTETQSPIPEDTTNPNPNPQTQTPPPDEKEDKDSKKESTLSSVLTNTAIGIGCIVLLPLIIGAAAAQGDSNREMDRTFTGNGVVNSDSNVSDDTARLALASADRRAARMRARAMAL